MSFTAEQKSALAAPLSSAHVKTRNQGGRAVSYVEGWHAIAEANRIFGFDAWCRETVELKCVSEREREIGKDKAPGWGVTYIARVRITVFSGTEEVIREGCGTGHGIDRDLGQAHESALKEAETDAMKRALMTFGNPFGLALYDKQQAGVADEVPAKTVTRAVQSGADIKMVTDLKRQMNECKTVADFDALVAQTEFKHAFHSLPESLQGDVLAHGKTRRSVVATPILKAG
jgi:DNA recombination protein Rad52